MIHQDLAHEPGRYGEELRPVLPVHLRLIHQLDIGLVYQRGCLQRMTTSLGTHVALRDAPQFAFQAGNQAVQTLPLAGSPAKQ